ncbi:hypothetical protein [Sphingobium nicotianae]|uniref:DUF1330 domain-containing protein n=1 Tax=Sphingobium nicotianae TaxID=2782607 RepID=A0A9X1DD03_9SPHN|nr:hypothetical protein [Sphingobium nicotianae]MBT2187781.1 hypothetical protein [Sphingobium nicotianae]
MQIGTALRIGAAVLCALTLGAAAAPQRDLYEVIAFQDGGAPALADMNPRVLSVIAPTRADLGPSAIYIETDQAGLVRVNDDAQLPNKGPLLIYKALGPHLPSTATVRAGAASLVPGAKGQPRTYYLFAHLEPAEGKEQTFNDFYDATHLTEVIAVPGMQWGMRGRLVSQSPETFDAPRYSAIYEFKSYDLKATMAEVDRRLKVGITKAFPMGSVGRNVLVFYAGPATK